MILHRIDIGGGIKDGEKVHRLIVEGNIIKWKRRREGGEEGRVGDERGSRDGVERGGEVKMIE